MAWIVFISGAIWFWAALTATTGSFRGDVLQFCWLVTSALIMIVAMYLRSIGW